MRLTGIIPKQMQIRLPPWLKLRRKPELDLLPLELDFLYGLDPLEWRIISPSGRSLDGWADRPAARDIYQSHAMQSNNQPLIIQGVAILGISEDDLRIPVGLGLRLGIHRGFS